MQLRSQVSPVFLWLLRVPFSLRDDDSPTLVLCPCTFASVIKCNVFRFPLDSQVTAPTLADEAK